VLSRSQPYRSESHGVIARRSAAADPQSIVPLAQEPACLGYCAGVEPAGTESVPRAWRGSAVYAEHLLSLDRGCTKIAAKAAIGLGWKICRILYAQFFGG
jgi:hypothetical protein